MAYEEGSAEYEKAGADRVVDLLALNKQFEDTNKKLQAALLIDARRFAEQKKYIKQLEDALLSHRWDLHQGSNRPCPTCRESASALSLKVPDQCARKEWDAEALKDNKGDSAG